MKKKLIIAHRGDTSSAVENTVSAFQNAIDKGADMIEIDVRRTKDGVLIVHHGRRADGKMIEKLDWAGIEKLNRKRKFEIPRLEDVLRRFKGKTRFDIELKEMGYELEVVRMARKYLGGKDFIVTSFNDFSVSEIKKNFPEIRTGLLLSLRRQRSLFSPKRKGLLSRKRYQSSPVDYFLPHVSLVKMGFLKMLRRYKKPLIVWSVNDKKTLKKLLKKDIVAGVIVDKLQSSLDLKNNLGK